MWEWIEKERLAELRDVASPTIAFHIRGGDIFEADKDQAGAPLLSRLSSLPHPHDGLPTGTDRGLPDILSQFQSCLYMT